MLLTLLHAKFQVHVKFVRCSVFGINVNQVLAKIIGLNDVVKI